MLTTMQRTGESPDGWDVRYLDPATGTQWTLTSLGSERHGDGVPILIRDPAPGMAELVELAASSVEPAEIAASAWLLLEADRHGNYREPLLLVAEAAASAGDRQRAELLVAWGCLTGESNLRPTLGKTAAEITADHDYFCVLAARAKALLPPVGAVRDGFVFA